MNNRARLNATIANLQRSMILRNQYRYLLQLFVGWLTAGGWLQFVMQREIALGGAVLSLAVPYWIWLKSVITIQKIRGEMP